MVSLSRMGPPAKLSLGTVFGKWTFRHPVTLERVMADDTSQLTERLQAAGGRAQQQLAELLAQCRGRLRKMVEVRLDRRLQGRVDPSDVIQEALLEASSRLQDYLRDPSMPFFLWLRFITRQKLMVLHRRHLGTRARDANREVSLYGGRLPQARSRRRRWADLF